MPLGLGVSKMNNFPSEKDLDEVRKKLDTGIASKPLSRNATAVDKTKFKLCEKFVIYKNTHKLTQRSLAEKLGINESLMSKILHYHFSEFTTDRLIKYLSIIYPDIDVQIDVA